MAERGGSEFWAFLAGALLGGIVAMLYAPAKGVETRERIRTTADDVRVKGENIVVRTREEAEKLIDIGKKKLDELKKHAEPAKEEEESK
jgi:gas vesicle protein